MSDEKDLKTLDDIAFELMDDPEEEYDLTTEHFYDNLRDNAREWVKEIKQSVKEGEPMPQEPFWEHDRDVLGSDWRNHYLSIVVWIKHFFDLGE